MKVKEKCQQYEELFFDMEISFMEWLRDNFPEPTEVEINEMEQKHLQEKYKASNNTNYKSKDKHEYRDNNDSR